MDEIDDLMLAANVAMQEFHFKHYLLNYTSDSLFNFGSEEQAEEFRNHPRMEVNEAIIFKHVINDLCSILDYICYFLHCHFHNDGKAVCTPEARNVKFPCIGKGLYDVEKCHQDQKEFCEKKNEQFRSEQDRLLFNFQDHRVKEYFMKMVQNVQLMRTKNAAGNVALTTKIPKIDEWTDRETFNLLHFYRNLSTHRYLVMVKVKEGYLNSRVVDYHMEREFTTEARQGDGWSSTKIARGMWIMVPNDLNGQLQSWTVQPFLRVLR